MSRPGSLTVTASVARSISNVPMRAIATASWSRSSRSRSASSARFRSLMSCDTPSTPTTRPGRVPDAGDPGVDPHPRPVLAVVLVLPRPLGPGGPRADLLGHPGPDRLGEPVGVGAADHLLRRPAEEAGGPLVPVGDDPVQVGHDDRVVDVRQEHRVPGQPLLGQLLGGRVPEHLAEPAELPVRAADGARSPPRRRTGTRPSAGATGCSRPARSRPPSASPARGTPAARSSGVKMIVHRLAHAPRRPATR